MISKELIELIDAISRDEKNALPPYKELQLLGFDPFGNELEHDGRKRNREEFAMEDIQFPESSEESHKHDDGEEIDWNKTGYYEFDENDKRYAMLLQVLRMSNDRRRYFA